MNGKICDICHHGINTNYATVELKTEIHRNGGTESVPDVKADICLECLASVKITVEDLKRALK